MKGLSKTEINQTYQVTLDLKEALYSAYKKKLINLNDVILELSYMTSIGILWPKVLK